MTEAISASMAECYRRFYGHDRTTPTTYINDNVVVCVDASPGPPDAA